MGPRLLLLAMTFAAAAPLAAQDARDPDPRIVVHEIVRDVLQNTRIVRVKDTSRGYQGRNNGPEQTERIARKIKLGRDGRVSVANIAGDMVVTTGSGDELSIEAVKRTRGDKSELGRVQVVIDERPGRVDVRTDHETNRSDRRGDSVSVDYTLVVPSGAAVDLHSVSGTLKVTGARGSVRVDTISGDVVVTDSAKVEGARSVSGNVTISGVATDGDLAASTVSGNLQAKAVKVHGLALNSISGSIAVADASCERFSAKSVSGGVTYGGAIVKGGSYDVNVHSGTVRFVLADPAGFVLNANSFSGSIRSDLPLTIGGTGSDPDSRGRRNFLNSRSMRATYGDGSATLTLRTFSGDIVLAKR